MMLLYKAWFESRRRFLLGAAAIIGLSAVFVLFNHAARPAFSDHDISYAEYIWKAVFKGQLREVYVILTLLLGMGGLDREREYGTAGFTLAIPVSRWRLIVARGVAGVVETIVLSFLPAIVIPVLSPLVQEVYPWRDALRFGLLWAVGGVLIFTMGFLASVLVKGEYAAAIAAIAALFAYSMAADLPGAEHYIIDIHDTMNGTGPHGPVTLAMISLAAAAMIGASGVITRRRDY